MNKGFQMMVPFIGGDEALTMNDETFNLCNP